jgi:hypothetical protein
MTLIYHNNEFIFPGNNRFILLKEAFEYAYNVYGVQMSEFIQALVDMQNKSNNVAEFGDINGSFMWSEKLVS